MKAGLVTSVTLHAVLLGFGIFSLSAPSAYEVADVDALPVDIVPVSSLTRIQEGDKQAELSDRPMPRPTERPDPVENAQKVGEADEDLDTPPTPDPKPTPVEEAAEPPPAPEPTPAPESPEEEPQPAPVDDASVPTAEPEPAPQQEATPEPAEEVQVTENAEQESLRLPDTVPVPNSRPERPATQTAASQDTETNEKPVPQETAEADSNEEEDQLLDQVAALLNKQDASGGGAKRSDEEAALGGEKPTTGETLTQSETDALQKQIEGCWNVPAGALDAENIRVSLKFRLDPTGAVEGNPQVISGGSGSSVERAAAASARRAILQCAPYNLPAGKYGAWSEVVVNFDPSDMF